jgi:hypothetical protein
MVLSLFLAAAAAVPALAQDMSAETNPPELAPPPPAIAYSLLAAPEAAERAPVECYGDGQADAVCTGEALPVAQQPDESGPSCGMDGIGCSP